MAWKGGLMAKDYRPYPERHGPEGGSVLVLVLVLVMMIVAVVGVVLWLL